MFGLFKKKMSESAAAIVFCVHINHWAAENDDNIKKDFLHYFLKDTVMIDDLAPHSDGLFNATVAECSKALFNLFPLPQALRLRNKVYDAMGVMGQTTLFEFFMDAKNDPDRHLLQNDPMNEMHAIPARLLEYWLGEKLRRLYVKMGDVELLSPVELMFISEAMSPMFMFWKNFQNNYKIIESDETVTDLMR
ncbi:hypothetical protein [Desulfovibrio sp. 86]|uniref:Uncharacterized protein n=1 Tax=uncultured Desulfovibrio sp. TaxID=167968 RepID=A0A212L7K8_9BACT|nr:hypothetical protein [Desulfovibrio sp. 86]SCM73508.1 hypothetical protein KL86DES1_21341 [uncultured Desulfovibrio sp.]VZH34240.1 conserved protein of unknown function [Desulfovibrio sp. 86]